MSEDASKQDRTEQASPRRLHQAAEEGDIPVGRDLAMFASLLGGGLALWLGARAVRDSMVHLVWTSVDKLPDAQPGHLVPFLTRPLALALGITAAGAIAATFAFGVQTNLRFWGNLAVPDFTRVFSLQRLKRLVEKEFPIDLGLSLVKVLTVSAAVWSVFRDEFMTLPRLLTVSPEQQLAAVFRPFATGMVKILTAFALIAGLDFAIARWRHRDKMKMTKEDAKRDHREEEGDPTFRARRKRRHREMLKGQIKVEVPRADALIVNPTHIAVAIRYRAGEDKAPRVTAKGKGQLAELMRELAREHGIPIVEDIPLARLLYRRVKVGRTVPAQTYKAVAAVLAFVYRVLGRTPMRGGGR